MKLTKDKIKTAIALFSAITMSWLSPAVFALDTTATETAIEHGIFTLEIQQNISEGGWGSVDGLDYIYTAAAVEALRASNERNGTYYSGLAWLENHNANNIDLEARKIMALVNRGNNITPDLNIVQNARRDTTQAGWGLSAGYAESPLESALVVQALFRANDGTNLDNAVNYLIEQQRSDGGWATSVATNSNLWFSAEVVLALIEQQRYEGVNTALAQAATYLASASPSNLSASTLARVTLALYQVNGVDTTVDDQVTALLAKQVNDGDWGDVLATANAVNTLAHILNLNPVDSEVRVILEDEQLRIAINQVLARENYSHITRADLDSLTTLDLRNTNVTSLNGLQGASNLANLWVRAGTDISALDNIAALTVTFDTDLDDIADAIDNCVNIANENQANLDNDTHGDVCDNDIDGDQIPNTWEISYSFNHYSVGDASLDTDRDGLTNLQEYQLGTHPRDSDTDGDKAPDGWEVANNLDPLNPLDGVDPEGDEDRDGLTNLEELAWGTDINNPDTDGDNTFDGAEVAIGRNPLVNEPVLMLIINGLLL